jgi:predicted nucleotidyltransferase
MTEVAHPVIGEALLFGLPKQTMQTLAEIFAGQSKVKRVLIYGSRAKGSFREGSDIDLTLDAPDLSFSEKLKINAAIAESNIPYVVDLSVFHELKHVDLLDHIARVGQVFYSRQS